MMEPKPVLNWRQKKKLREAERNQDVKKEVAVKPTKATKVAKATRPTRATKVMKAMKAMKALRATNGSEVVKAQPVLNWRQKKAMREAEQKLHEEHQVSKTLSAVKKMGKEQKSTVSLAKAGAAEGASAKDRFAGLNWRQKKALREKMQNECGEADSGQPSVVDGNAQDEIPKKQNLLKDAGVDIKGLNWRQKKALREKMQKEKADASLL